MPTWCPAGGIASSVPAPSTLCDSCRHVPRPLGSKQLVGPGPRYAKEVLERFRLQLLQKHLSLHDAFARMDRSVSREKALAPREFRLVLARLGAGEDDFVELFAAMDTNGSGSVSLSEFLHALVDVSPGALLWELRVKLLRFGLRKHNLHKTMDFVRWHQHGSQAKAAKLKRREWARGRQHDQAENAAVGNDSVPVVTPTSSTAPVSVAALANSEPDCGQGEDVEHTSDAEGSGDGFDEEAPCSSSERERDEQVCAGSSAESHGGSCGSRASPNSEEVTMFTSATVARRIPFQLGRTEWLKFCALLGLTLLEAGRLWDFIGEEAGIVDLRDMHETLRTTVAPDVSLERFTTKIVMRFDSIRDAFRKFAKGHEMRYPDFHELAKALDVNDGNADHLWHVLKSDASTLGAEGDHAEGHPALGITEETFVGQMLLWQPDTELSFLKEQLSELFGSLAQARRRLRRHGLAGNASLTPARLEAGLRVVGIAHCDASKLLCTVAGTRGGHLEQQVTLEHIIMAMRSSKPRSGKADGCSASNTVKNATLPLWQQLREMQAELQRGYNDDDESSSEPLTPTCRSPRFAGHGGRSRCPTAARGSVNTLGTSQVLNRMHEQVLQVRKNVAVTKRRLPVGTDGSSFVRVGPQKPDHEPRDGKENMLPSQAATPYKEKPVLRRRPPPLS